MDKVVVFGGSFDPIHLGHTACLRHLTERMDLSKVFLVPTSINPLKIETPPASQQDRMEMIRLALHQFSPEVSIDKNEIEKEDAAYTWDTLQRYLEDYEGSGIYLAMGQDSFMQMDQWKNFEDILSKVNIIVLSRPPFIRPFSLEDFPQGIQPLIHSYEKGFCLLKTNLSIEFVKIDTEDISSSDIRRRLRRGKKVGSFLPMEVEKYIVENQVYPQAQSQDINFEELTQFCGKFLDEKAMNAVGYDLRDVEKPFDFSIVSSATSTKQAQSLAKNLRDAVKEEFGLSPFVEDGYSEGRWVVLDYAGLVVHVFYDFVRQEYHLEQLWAEGKRLKFSQDKG